MTLYMEASYPAGGVTRQRRDTGCCRLKYYLPAHCLHGQADNSPRRDLGKDLGELTIVPCKHFSPSFSARRDKILLKARVFCITGFAWTKENGGS